MEKISSFTGEHEFLSNFHASPITIEGITYPSVEHAFQAYKTEDHEERVKIANLATPGQAKRAGRKVKLREDWELIKVSAMTVCLKRKFNTHPDLAAKLKATGDTILEEGNTWNDTFWGVCRGKGKNTLGILLMSIRSTL